MPGLSVSELKQATYPGTAGPVPFAYLVREIWNEGCRAYFSGLAHGTSTILAAERVVQIICELEGLDWRTTRFYDIQTTRGYPGRQESGYFHVDRLKIVRGQSGGPYVLSWDPIASSDRDEENPELPRAILDAFLRLAYGE